MGSTIMAVRLPGMRDSDLNSMDRESIVRRLEAEQSSLLPRTFSAAEPPQSQPPLRVMQFNVLADGLVATSEFVTEERVLDWKMRKWRLLAVILQHQPDVIALEEVDHFEDWFKPALEQCGYEGCCGYKYDSPSYRLGNFSDGSALFWRTERLTFHRDHSTRLEVGDTDVPLTSLRLREINSADRRCWDFAVVHLKAKIGAPEEKQRTGQVRRVLQHLAELRQGEVDDDDATAVPLRQVLLGDFNTDSYGVKDKQGQLVPATCIPAVLADGWISALPLPDPEAVDDTLWTTMKQRANQPLIRHTIDYVFLRPEQQLCCGRYLCAPAASSIDPLPSAAYPSDHLALVVDLVVPEVTQSQSWAGQNEQQQHGGPSGVDGRGEAGGAGPWRSTSPARCVR